MSTLIISSKELERIKASILPPVEDRPAYEKKKELKKKSEERLKNWPNTLEALRLKKENFLKEREDKAELERQEIDRQEAEIRRVMRLESISRANELLYDQTDKMKMLKGQRLYAEVIHTRYQQIDKKLKEKEKEYDVEKIFHERILDQVSKGEREEQLKEEKRKKQIEEIKITRKQQLEENKKRKEEEINASYEEGQKMKRDAKLRLQQEMEEQERKHKYSIDNNMRMLKANNDLKLVREQLQAQEAAAALAREAEVESIEKRKKDLKSLQQQHFDKKQETRMKMIERAVESLSKQSNQEQAILSQQIADQKDKEDKVIADKQTKLQREWDETVKSRTAQIQRKREQQQQQQAEEDALALRFRLENEEAMREESEKRRRAKDEQTRVKLLQLEEGKSTRQRREEERLAEIEQSKFLSSLGRDDDKRFTEVCKAEIERNVKLGKPVYTLLRALEFTQPALLAAKTVKVNNK